MASKDHLAEPIFVLRARDKHFVPIVRLWIELVEADAAMPVPDEIAAAAWEAVELANQAIDWQNANPELVKNGGSFRAEDWIPSAQAQQ